MEKTDYIHLGEGLLRSYVLFVILILCLALTANFISIKINISNVLILISSMLGLIYGTIYATRKIKRKGWLIGLIMGTLYITIILGVSIISGNKNTLNMNSVLLKMVLSIATGTLSGMLGINL
ncbi:MAG: TIGR04086 family membrane protein [Bacillota bacterium]|nr:TIGR04086 family membrane protein [Bacillota bacterium]